MAGKTSVVYIGLGSNQGDRRKNLRGAIQGMASLPGTHLIQSSSFYKTRAQGGGTQPDFLNAVVSLKTRSSPRELLKALQGIERQLGRARPGSFWGPRPVDLDILFYGARILGSSALILPHPRLHERRFVLEPLAEIAPGFRHPVLKKTVQSLLEEQKRRKMKVIGSVSGMRTWVNRVQRRGETLGFVPTMGALHEGHACLMRAARRENDQVVVSLFVNPTQFGPQEDFERYPRNLKGDLELCRGVGVDCIFAPSVGEMYPAKQGKGLSTAWVDVNPLGDLWEGASRPGFFRGVATVVSKLFNIVQPTCAYFGQKDAQQVKIVATLIEDLKFPIRLRVLPIVREADGLALSSRNAYLSSDERRRALVVGKALQAGRRMLESGVKDRRRIVSAVETIVGETPGARLDYVGLVDASNFEEKRPLVGKILILLAVWIGRTRLIDNLTVRVR